MDIENDTDIEKDDVEEIIKPTVQEIELLQAKSRYLFNSSECPFCKSADLHCANALVDAGGAVQDVVCRMCGASWVDVYTMTDVIMMKKGKV